MMFFDSLLEPMLTMACAGGPMNTIPSFKRVSENFAFSLRNPYLERCTSRQIHFYCVEKYPGCTACG